MKKPVSYFCTILFALMLVSCNGSRNEPEVKTEEIKFKKEGEAYLIKAQDTLKKLDIELADNAYERATGLMYRESLKENRGMFFIFTTEAPRSFYMKNTYIPLDIIYYSKDSSVVSFVENTIPLDETSLPSEKPAQFVLEVNAGKVAEWNIEEGDLISFHATTDISE